MLFFQYNLTTKQARKIKELVIRKIFFSIVIVILTMAIVLPEAFSASFKFSGAYRYRGVSYDNADQDHTSEDGNQKADMLFRPRFTATSEGGKVKAVWELDLGSSAWAAGKTAPKVNRHYVYFSLPGSKFRLQYGRDDYDTMDGVVVAPVPNRTQGWQISGKVSGMELIAWTTKISEGSAGGSAGPWGGSTDADLFYVGLSKDVNSNLNLQLGLVVESDNRGATTATPDRDIRWWSVNTSTKFAGFDISALYALQEGDLDYPTSSTTVSDIQIKAYMMDIQAFTSVGKTGVTIRLFATSGDDSTLDASQTHGMTAQDDDNKLKRYTSPNSDGASDTDLPQLVNGRYVGIGIGSSIESATGAGSGGTVANGMKIFEIIVSHPISKKLTFDVNISSIHASSSAQDIRSGTQYVSDKNIGTEFDGALKYQIYKSLYAMIAYAYLKSGDYGKATNATKDKDDIWGWFFEVKHTF